MNGADTCEVNREIKHVLKVKYGAHYILFGCTRNDFLNYLFFNKDDV